MSEYSLAEAMKAFLSQSKLKGSMQAFQIEEIWEQLLGKTVAKYTEKIRIHGSTLYIHTTVAPLRQELLYQKKNIMDQVNKALGENLIREVVIK
jgi:hypothetical protein